MLKLVKAELAKTLGIQADFDVTVPEVQAFGHYSTNVAMRLAKEAKKPPFDLATEFAAKLEGSKMFSKAEAIKPGFINLWLSDRFLAEQFTKVMESETESEIGKGKTVVIDQCGTNIAKPMHVGHLRSTVIGAALSNMYEAVGYKAIRWNYLGDWGTQFGKLIAAYKLWGNKKEVEAKPIETLLALYIRFHEEMKTKPELEKSGQEEFRKLEEGNVENRKLWEWFKDESMLEFDKLYKRLGVSFTHNIGEAYYLDAMREIVEDLKEKKFIVPSEGGWVAHLEQYNLPVALVQKSDGASLYITRDIASIRHRISKYKPEKLLYVVANEQTLHFQQLFAIAKLLGITTPAEHIKFGMVLGEDGKKLSTREGKAVKLEDLINQITDRAYQVVNEKNAELPEQEKREIAEIVGIGALKYNDLKENRVSDITFNWDRMLDFHGDSAPYLQYTVVRLMSIVRKAGKIKNPDIANVSDELKPVLMKKMIDFGDVIELCVATNLTSHMAKYLLELAKLGSQYYESVRILDDSPAGEQASNIARRNGRLLLIESVAKTLTAGLKLLGIAVPERI